MYKAPGSNVLGINWVAYPNTHGSCICGEVITAIAQRNGCYVDGETIMALQYYIGAQLMGRQDIAHLESQYSWAQIRLAAYSQGSRPSAQVPEG